ncbi:MAG: NAD(P)/FAD-dependent oxidoreductase [Cyanothece sp. SIO2G6]|nr:NAD(P)/FAD-dependent oxidoreductase [Cyanothece sp. SIO2G6]
MRQIIVIGGGAAGLFGAIACAQSNPDNVQVTVLEAGANPLAKVKVSGGGRCNVTHACFDPDELVTHYPRGYRALRGPFRQFQPQDTIAWFAQQGVTLKTEKDGRIFPVTDTSQTIIDCLLDAVTRHQIKLYTRSSVESVQPVPAVLDDASTATQSGFGVQLKSGQRMQCDRLLIATGGHPSGYRLVQSLGHTLEPPIPSLFTFNIADDDLTALAGVTIGTVRAQLDVPGAKPLQQQGPLLITHWGMSGPVILKLSAWGARLLHDCHYQAKLRVHWLATLTQDEVRQTLLTAKNTWCRKAIATACPVGLPRRFWRYIIRRSNITDHMRWADLSKPLLHQLVQTLTQDKYIISGKGVFKEEFVKCGGVRLKDVNLNTMASRRCPGLFFAGEILDIDGVTGGFNFQNAWTTGWLAGQALGH